MTIRISLTVGALALAGTLALGGCGSAGRDPGRPVATLSLRALSSLTNYRARLTSGIGKYHMTIETQVHSPQNWQAKSGFTVLHIGATSYVHFDNQWFAHPDQPNAYAQNNLPAFARQFYGMTRVRGVAVRRGGPCRQADLTGQTWTVSAAGGSTFGERYRACVADGSGALLKLAIAASGAGMRGRDAGEVYEITAIGDVPAFRVPAAVRGR